MINGVPAGFFSNSKGLRQGDPLSPYLFVLGMEVLNNLIRRAADGGFLSASKEQLSALSWILAWFEAASSLKINLDKSVLIPVGEVEDIEEMAVELGCKVGLLPTVYLGLPLGAHHKAVSIWDGVEERMKKRLAQWKRHYISKGGCITLIKCTMASLPIYNMSLFRMPKSVEEFGWRTKEARGTYGVGVWKEIMKEAKWCWDNIKFKVGKETRVKFWSNQWCGDERDFKLSSEEDVVLWKRGGGGGAWEVWVKGAYNGLVVINACDFPYKGVWVDKVPTKAAFFAWEATWGKILTLDGLQKWGWQFPNRLGVPRVSEGGVIQFEGSLCGKKRKKNLEFYPVVYFLDGMEGKE
ncbi:hypothetical protein CK203_029438 [Vitis vinifera]|uniref:Reverse transcriptase zinc-binding domain-containing protein n=1 Tax=Vitis vinifera TaxID=29760 RepID=A0A438HWY9_VITVI|nr:hypothetical protein CK203_029438 [Vitis vinifera]